MSILTSYQAHRYDFVSQIVWQGCRLKFQKFRFRYARFFGENDFYEVGINFEKGQLEYFFKLKYFLNTYIIGFGKEKPNDSPCINSHIDCKNIIHVVIH
jgi:hypothetical protein